MPRSRSSSIESSSCGRCFRESTAPVISRMRSASVDFPWSMWAMIEKFRMLLAGADMGSRLIMEAAVRSAQLCAAAAAEASAEDLADLLDLGHAERPDRTAVREHAGGDGDRQRQDLRPQRAPERLVERPPRAVQHAAHQDRAGAHA